MELIEIRDLDGPNLFALHPVIKLEVRLAGNESVPPAARQAAASLSQNDLSDDPIQALEETIVSLHRRVDLPAPHVGRGSVDTPGHAVVFFDWEWRSSAILIAETAFAIVSGHESGVRQEDIAAALERDRRDSDQPLWVRDSERRIPIVGITGTNGKTTTTRLIAHILRTVGKHVGWSSSTGVYIDGEQVVEGDYTGPSGARRVLEDQRVEIGVLETARGGILLRGLGYESNDVGVFLNVSADHLGTHGIDTIDTLTEVKSVVVRVTRLDGLVVLNADDPRVLAQRGRVRAAVLLTSQNGDSRDVSEHIRGGGKALVRRTDAVIYHDGHEEHHLFDLANAPMAYGGIATHMIENALAACGAAIGLGVSLSEIRDAIATFRPDLRSNPGRLNVFRLDDRIVVVDYAHNESGLEALLRFTRELMGNEGRLAAIIGTAGDRPDDALVGLGHVAGQQADLVFIKDNPSYLRGRQPGEIPEVIRRGIDEVGGQDRLAGAYPGEHAALIGALQQTSRGDAIAIMCVEEQLAIYRELRDRGAEEWS